MNHKEKWNKLLSEEDYQEKYIFSDSKEGRTALIEYRESGKRDYSILIEQDKLLKDYLGNFRNKIVMEIGCGDGRMTEFFDKNFKYVYAIDISKEVIKKGKERLKKYKNISWFETDGTELPICKIDFIFSYAVFQHCKREMIIEILKSMNKILLTVGIAKIQVRGEPVSKNEWRSGDWFTSVELRKLVEDSGFECNLIWHDPDERRYLWIWLT